MSDLNETTLTEAVLARFADTPDPRLKQLVTALVRHLHAYVREVAPSFDEWSRAIDYLTRTGQTCSATRQEYILLFDVLGVSMLVDAINHRRPEGATETTVLGPFFVEDAPQVANGGDISAGMQGERLHVSGQVSSVGGGALAGATVDVWQADADGFYDVQRPDLAEAALRARLRTDAHGDFRFWSIQPSSYPIPHDGPVGELLDATKRHPTRPAHVHFMISAPGHETLVTHVFVAGDPYLDTDPVFGVKRSLVRDYAHHPAGEGPDGHPEPAPWRSLHYDFALKPVAG
jgi:hydroxyquinol 1,2-dioxygenase